MNSHVLTGRLMHSRQAPVRNAFTYPVFHLLLDLDDLPELGRRGPLFGYNRFGLASVYDRDHLGDARRSIRDNLDDFLRSSGVEPPGGRTLLLTSPRIFGYVFNPVSFYYCHDRTGDLAGIVAEVNNTFGERHVYLLNEANALPGGRHGARRYWADKRFYVSPFIEMDARYEFTFSPVGEKMSVHIDEFRRGEKFFQARLWGRTEPLTSRALVGALLRYPFMTLQVIGLIHWQALKLHRLGATWVPKPAA